MGQRSYPQCFPLKTDDRRHTSKPGFRHARIESMALNYQKTNGRTLEASSSSPGRAKMDLERFPSGLDANNFKNPWNSLKTYLDWMFAMSNIKMSHHNWIIVFIIVLLDCVEKTSMIGYYIYVYTRWICNEGSQAIPSSLRCHYFPPAKIAGADVKWKKQRLPKLQHEKKIEKDVTGNRKKHTSVAILSTSFHLS